MAIGMNDCLPSEFVLVPCPISDQANVTIPSIARELRNKGNSCDLVYRLSAELAGSGHHPTTTVICH